MKQAPPLARTFWLSAACTALAQLSCAALHPSVGGVGFHSSDGRSGTQEPEHETPEPAWAEERALVDGAREALERSDYAAARERVARAIDALLSHPRGEHEESWTLLLEAAGRLAWEARDGGSAKRAIEQVLEVRSRTLPADHPDLSKAKQSLGALLGSMGDLHGAHALFEEVLEVRSRTLRSDHPDLQAARGNLAITLLNLGDLQGARALQEEVLEVRSRTLPEDAPELQRARIGLASTLKKLGDHLGARALEEAVLEVYVRTLPADHPDLQHARLSLASTIKTLGDLHGARALEEAVLEAYARTLPADHPELQRARLNLASTIKALGDLHGAHALEEGVLEVYARALPADHPDLLLARQRLAATLAYLGDLHEARALFEEVLEVRSRTYPEDHPDLQLARLNLASVLHSLGELHRARALLQGVLEVYSRTYPEDHRDLQLARGNLAGTIQAIGDLQAARALREQVLEVWSRTLSGDHPDLQWARQGLAGTLSDLGELDAARALFEEVLEVRARTLPAEHPDLQATQLSLAVTLQALGELDAARALYEGVLEVYARTLPADHPALQLARGNLASTIKVLGDLHGAHALEEGVLEVYARTLPDHHPRLQRARQNLAWTLAELAASAAPGEEAQAQENWVRALALLEESAGGARGASRAALWTASVREAEEQVAHRAEGPLAAALSFAAGLGRFDPTGGLVSQAFELSEATRAAGLAAAALARAPIEPAVRERLRAEIRAAGEELAGLAQHGGTREEYHRARERREAAERELVVQARELAREGLGALELAVDTLAEALGPDRALVGFRRYDRSWLAESESPDEPLRARFEERWRECLGAFVLRSLEGEPRLVFVDLGAASEIEEAVQVWRNAIGVGGGSLDLSSASTGSEGRGIGILDQPAGFGLSEAIRVRRLIWDPLVEALGDATHVVVALDDVVHLLPLDALPGQEDGELVGDHWRVETRVALWELLDAPRPPSSQVALVSLGGAAFDSEPLGLGAAQLAALESHAEEEATSSNEQVIALLRGGAWERGFTPLAYSRREAQGLAQLFEEAFEERFDDSADASPALVLDRARASRSALIEAAPQARFLHVATHGWFAPESVRSWADADERTHLDGMTQRVNGEDTVRGMSPMLLCGLALAGANLPADAVGRIPGLMTAEELSTLDLTGCELAVLSACDTNVGERRAGQGVASLQKALHMAGARSVITSLWKVPDEATSELMLDFYRRLWVEQKPKHQALWEAKMRLRHAKDQNGEPLYTVRDWAAWVLTGEPD